MRVRVGYGIETEDIPELAESLGFQAYVEIKEACECLKRALDNIEESEQDFTLVLSMFEKVRSKLNKSDLIISDLEAILEGLGNYYIGEKNVSEGRSTVDSSGNTTTPTENNGEG